MKEELFWLDDSWNFASEDEATLLIIRKVRDDGELFMETFVQLFPKSSRAHMEQKVIELNIQEIVYKYLDNVLVTIFSLFLIIVWSSLVIEEVRAPLTTLYTQSTASVSPYSYTPEVVYPCT